MSSTRSLPTTKFVTYGCYLGLLIASITLLYAMNVVLTDSDEMMVYKAAVVLCGVIEGVASLYALQHNRAAWSFGLAINGTLTVVFLFGAPRMRDALDRAAWITDRIGDVPLILGFIPAVAFAATTTLLALGSDEF